MPTNLAVTYDVKAYRLSWSTSADATHHEVVEDPDGAGPAAASITSVAAVAGTTQTSTVALPSLLQRLNAQYRVRACNAAGCSLDTAPISPNLTEAIGYFKASNTGAGDQFGYSVALSADGHTLAVGAYLEASDTVGVNGNEASNTATQAGAVYVFSLSGTTWSQQAYVKASNAEAGDQFGFSVALSADGHTLAVGAAQEDSNATGVGGNQTNGASNAGAVYLFNRSGATWSQQAYLKASNAEAGDRFGFSVALAADGQTLAVGARQEASSAVGIGGVESNNLFAQAGAVYVFSRSGVIWDQQAYVKASNTEAGDLFGHAVALSADGNTLAVSALEEDSAATGVDGSQMSNLAAQSGAVYVFSRMGAAWSQQAYVKASNTEAGDLFGHAVTLSADGTTLAVSALEEDSAATGVDGSQTTNLAAQSGAVYVFSRMGAAWSQQAYVKASNTETFDLFGQSVALSADGNTLAVGAYLENSPATGIGGSQANGAGDAGAVYVFGRTGTAWSQRAYVKASNTGASDLFGSSVALSGDGSTLAVGAPAEDSGATGIRGDAANNSASSAGAVYLY